MEGQLPEVPHEHPAAVIAAPTIGSIKLRNLISTFYAVGLTRRPLLTPGSHYFGAGEQSPAPGAGPA
jgi:hypothetical protein